MKWLRRIFFHDMGRKFLALALATFAWWQVGQSVAEDRTHNFTIVTVDHSQTPAAHSLQIKIPDGWELVSPEPGTSVAIAFQGAPANLAAFFASQCAATFEPLLDATSGETTKTVDLISLDELNWLKPSEASRLLKDLSSQSFRNFRFERRREATLALNPTLVTVQGNPADVYEAHQEEISFDPTQVRISGPHAAVEEALGRLESLRLGFPGAGIFTPIEIPNNRRDSLKAVVRLADSLSRRGVRMFPAQVAVRVPIRHQQGEPITWVPSADQLHGVGKAMEGEWALGAWSATPWLAELTDSTLLGVQFDEGWVRAHILLLVPLSQIPTGAVDGFELAIGWHLVGIDNDDLRQQLLRSLRVRPQNEEDRMVSMKLLGEQP